MLSPFTLLMLKEKMNIGMNMLGKEKKQHSYFELPCYVLEPFLCVMCCVISAATNDVELGSGSAYHSAIMSWVYIFLTLNERKEGTQNMNAVFDVIPVTPMNILFSFKHLVLMSITHLYGVTSIVIGMVKLIYRIRLYKAIYIILGCNIVVC